MHAQKVKPSLKRFSVLALHHLSASANNGKAFHMSEDPSKKMSREERLAAKLRENLRRRKTQGRAMKSESQDNGLPNDPRDS